MTYVILLRSIISNVNIYDKGGRKTFGTIGL